MTDLDQTDIVDVSHALADAARAAVLPHFRSDRLTIENKAAAGYDPVTEADRAAEAAMRRILAERRPADGILGEEEGRSAGTSGLTWVLDPIDGTRGFVAGTPVWGVLIALSDASGPRFGLIDQPYIGERFLGGLGRADWTGPQGGGRLRTRAERPMSQAIVMSTFPEIGTPEDAAAFARVTARAGLVRYGCDCYAYALLAMGQIDLVIEAGLHPYDIHAPIAVIRAAGGIVTDWAGGSPNAGGRIVAAANAGIHAAAMDLLRG